MRIIILVLFAILVLLGNIQGNIATVHAANAGLICFADVTSALPANPCSASGRVFNGPFTTPNQQIRIGVFVTSSPALIAFEIILKTDHSVLKPAGASLDGTILQNTLFLIEDCVGGVNMTVASCASNDNADTLHLVASGLHLTSDPVTGLLFTAIYNITGTTASSSSIGFQTGCKTESSVSDHTTCVAIVNGSPHDPPVPENTQPSSFANSMIVPYVTGSVNQSSVGPLMTNISHSVTLNFTGRAGWPGFNSCTCLVSLSHIETKGLKVSLNTTGLDMSSSGSRYASLTVSAAFRGVFAVTVYGQYSTSDSNGLTNTLVAPVNVRVLVIHPDFSLEANPNPLFAGPSMNADTIVTVSSVDGFTGSVDLTVSAQNIVCSLDTLHVVLGTSTNSKLSCRTSILGDYPVTVTGMSGTVSHSLTVSYGIGNPDFDVSTDTTTVIITAGTVGASTITVSPRFGFAGTVNFGVSLSPSGPTCSLSPTSVPNGSGNSTLSCKGPAGNYTATVIGTSSSLSHSVSVTYQIEDFTVLVQRASLDVAVGSSVNQLVAITMENGFAGSVSLSNSSIPSGVKIEAVNHNQTGPIVKYLLKVSSGSPGTYSVTLTGQSQGIVHSASFQLKVTGSPNSTPSQPVSSAMLTYLILGGVIAGGITLAFLGRNRLRRSSVG